NDEFCESWEGKDNTGIESDEIDGFVLHQNVPNPAHNETSIDFEVPYGGHAQFTVVDMFGRELYTEDMNVSTGQHRIDLEIDNFAAGIYYYHVTFDGQRIVRKMIIRK
ncbi:MAG: T9SS type A sorting domain-containing protein, partial [Bacteroidota bacterium]